MHADIVRRYHAERAKGAIAAHALAVAKSSAADPPYPFLIDLAHKGTVTGNVGPFVVTVRIEVDADWQLGDDDVSGWFTNTYEEHCVKNTANGRDSQSMAYYRPSNYTVAHAFNEYRAAGMSKSVARAALVARVQTEMFEDAEREYNGIVVNISVAGIDLATESLWGIDTVPGYDPEPYYWEVSAELIETAIEVAQEQLPDALSRNLAHASELRRALAYTPDAEDQ